MVSAEPLAVAGDDSREREPTMRASDRIVVHLATLERSLFFTQLADAKAAPLLALHGALAGATIAGIDHYVRLLRISTEGGLLGSVIASLLLATYAITAAVVVFLTLAVYYPVLRSTGRSLTFFADIRELPRDEFTTSSRAFEFDALEQDLLGQVYAVSHILGDKFQQLRWAYLLSGLALMSWIPLTVWAST